MIVGIDAINIRGGGGFTHLRELLAASDPSVHPFSRIVIWGGDSTLEGLPKRPWILKNQICKGHERTMGRLLWQAGRLGQAVRKSNCDVLFVPGSVFLGGFSPIVAMSQNLLPFQLGLVRESGRAPQMLKNIGRFFVQRKTFEESDGVVFLTDFAKKTVCRYLKIKGHTSIIPHGISQSFFHPPKQQRSIASYSRARPLNVLYVSTINFYKHQCNVIEAFRRLRRKFGWNLELTLIGGGDEHALRILGTAMASADPDRNWIRYEGKIPHDQLPVFYRGADLGVFASSCENLPIILLEKMAAGLPIASSCLGPMAEVLGDSASYFDPFSVQSIEDAVHRLLISPASREKLAWAVYEKATDATWERCAGDTFSFLASVVTDRQYQRSLAV